MTERYLQHNPNFPSGREAIAKLAREFMKPQPIAAKMKTPVVSVLAEGDLVAVASVLTLSHPKRPGETYTTTHFDMWRIKDGKADEHWDEALLGMAAPPPPPSQ